WHAPCAPRTPMSLATSSSPDAPRVGPAIAAPVRTEPVQRVVKVRRDYNEWVARETMEDYALRFTPRSFRKWSELRVANTALGAAIMAYALELAFDIPPAWGYLICALVVIPLVTHGVTVISKLQVWTQPLWIVLLVVPYVWVFQRNPGVLRELTGYAGASGQG